MRDVKKTSERYVPGFCVEDAVNRRVIVCPKCHAKIIPQNPDAVTRKAQNASMPVCQYCRQLIFTCSLCALPGRRGREL